MRTVSPPREVHIGKVVRDAAVFNLRNPREGTLSDSALLDAVDRLFALLEERRIDYLLVGGIALLKYVEGRNTEDIDLIMAPASLDRLPEIDGLQINLLLTSNPLFDEVRRRYATRQRFVEREIPCATPEGLVLLKLYALPSLYRQGDFTRVGLYETDVLTLMQQCGIDPEPLLAELRDHLSATDLEALRKIVGELRQRIARFGQEFQ
jgi:hypothetical protein